jgi:hypothetical protein
MYKATTGCFETGRKREREVTLGVRKMEIGGDAAGFTSRMSFHSTYRSVTVPKLFVVLLIITSHLENPMERKSPFP